MVAYTTRPIRVNEINGVDYHFVSEKEFSRLLKSSDFFDVIEVNGYRYGTPLQSFESTINGNETKVITLAIESAINLKRTFGNKVKIVYLIYNE